MLNPANNPLADSTAIQMQQTLQQLRTEFANPQTKDQKKLKEAAQQFEGIFIKQMLDAMDKTVDRSKSMLSGGSSEGYFRGMFYDEVSKSMSTRQGGSGFGLAENIYRQMSQSVQSPALAPQEALQMGTPETQAGD